MDEKLMRIRQLIELKEQTDTELETLIAGGTIDAPKRKKQTCGNCNQEGHTARTCPSPARTPQTTTAA